MSGLTHLEKQKLERELGMGGGYVLNFSNRTFEEFFRENLGVQIFADQFALGSGSKANRMRAFWQAASDKQLLALFNALLEGWDIYAEKPISDSARTLLLQVLKKLGGATSGKTPGEECATSVIGREAAQQFFSRLVQLADLLPQERGYKFEEFLKDLFSAYRLSARAPFRLLGEQIDGSFMLHNETYLLEAKWQNVRIGAADLHVFAGKLGQKAIWSRGLFVSWSGFSPEGLHAFGRTKQMICMDGLDLSEMLRRTLSLTDVLSEKVRKAAETGDPYVPVRELFI